MVPPITVRAMLIVRLCAIAPSKVLSPQEASVCGHIGKIVSYRSTLCASEGASKLIDSAEHYSPG